MSKLEAAVIEILKHRNGPRRFKKELRLALRHLTISQLQDACLIALEQMRNETYEELLFPRRS